MRGIAGTIGLILLAVLMAMLLPKAWAREDSDSSPLTPAGPGKVIKRSFFGQVEYQRQQELSVPLGSGAVLAAGTSNGSIVVTGRAEDGCDVTATITAKASSQKRAAELAAQVTVSLVPQDGQIRLDVQEPRTSGRESVRVDLKILVPRQTSPDLHSENGAIRINGLDGKITCRTDNGRIDLQSVSGHAELNSSNGSISATDLAADAQIRTDNGSVDLGFAEGDSRTCTIRSSNGRVTCRNLAGDLKADAGNGAVEATYAASASSACRIEITSQNGSIHLVTPRNLSAKITARSANGRIRTRLPLTVQGEMLGKRIEGTLGSGQGQVQLQSSNGSIELD